MFTRARYPGGMTWLALLLVAMVSEAGPDPARTDTTASAVSHLHPERFPRHRRQLEPKRRSSVPRLGGFVVEVPPIVRRAGHRPRGSGHGDGPRTPRLLAGSSAEASRHPAIAVVTKPLWTKKKKK